MKATSSPQFVMLQLTDLERMIQSISSRNLQLRDAAVMLALMTHTDTYSGRIKVTAHQLALDLNMQEADARSALARLKKENLLRLVNDKNTGERYYRLNPWMVRSSSKAGLWAMATREFEDA